MDGEQEKMQFLGLFGVYQESYKIIRSWRKIFSHITFTLILPLISFIFLIYKQVSDILFGEILPDSHDITKIERGTPQYEHPIQTISSEWDTFLFFNLICFTFILIFSILSTSAVVYTVTSIYTARKVSFNRAMSLVPKVLKRLMITFLCMILDFSLYIFMAVLLMWALTTVVRNYCGVSSFVAMMMVLYLAGFVYLNVVWKLASVVTLLEDSCGFEAMTKSKALVKGKMGLSLFILLGVNVPFLLIQFLFMLVIMGGWELFRMGLVGKVAFGIMGFLVSSHLLLFELVLQTVFYFVCKSYHCENVDKAALSNMLELEITQEECEPLKKVKDVQQDHLLV